MSVIHGNGILKRVLISKPEFLEPAPINEIAKIWKDTSLDKEKMAKEHEALVQAFLDNGVAVEYLEADRERPNAVFARDFGASIREGYILGRFRLDMRLKEHVDYEKRMLALGIPKVAEVKEGLFEGGDFMFLDEKEILIGMADRTNALGLSELQKQLEPMGYHVTGAPLNRAYLHLDMCFNQVDRHLAVAYMDGMPEEVKSLVKRLDIEIIPVAEEAIFDHGCNLQSLGGKRVLSLAKNQRVNEALDRAGMQVVELDITEILKAGGGPHCMTFPLERV